MTDLAAFPDVEIALRAVLGDLVPAADHIGTRVPADPDGTLTWLPFLRVACTGGGDNFVTDLSRVDVDAFAATKGEAAQLAENARQRLLGKPHVGDGFVLDVVHTDTKPHEVGYVDNPPPYRYTAAYALSARR
jgi:hypothetical protein